MSWRALNFGQLLPRTFVALLESHAVTKIGSGIWGDVRDDFEPVGIHLSPVLDTLWLMIDIPRQLFGFDHWSKPGLGGVCLMLYDHDYKPPFPLTAKLEKLAIKVDRPRLCKEDIRKLEEAAQRAGD